MPLPARLLSGSFPALPPSSGLVSSPSSLRHHSLPPGTSPLRLLLPPSWHRPPSSQLLGTCSLSMPLAGSPAPALSGPQRPPSFRHRLAKQDRTKALSGTAPFLRARLLSIFSPAPLPSPGHVSSSSPPSSHLLPTPRHLLSLDAPSWLPGTGPLWPPAPPFIPAPFGQTGPNGGPLFGPIWSNGLRSVLFGRTVPE